MSLLPVLHLGACEGLGSQGRQYYGDCSELSQNGAY